MVYHSPHTVRCHYHRTLSLPQGHHTKPHSTLSLPRGASHKATVRCQYQRGIMQSHSTLSLPKGHPTKPHSTLSLPEGHHTKPQCTVTTRGASCKALQYTVTTRGASYKTTALPGASQTALQHAHCTTELLPINCLCKGWVNTEVQAPCADDE